MAHDYFAKGRSNAGVRELAKQLLRFYRISNHYPVNVLACLRKDIIWTVFGIKRLIFKELPDAELGEDDARTTATRSTVLIEAKQSVVARAEIGVGRDRQTLAHELGHAVMHEGPAMARGTGAVGVTTPDFIPPYRSAEHQAKVFAPAFLIIDAFADTLTTPEDISANFGISIESAEIYWEEREKERNRDQTATRIQRMADGFRDEVAPKLAPIHYLDLECPSCKNRTLTPIGIKICCTSCEYVGDLPDGDPGEG